MILLFDLDRTIIDTEKFKRVLSNIFGISLKEYDSHVDLFFKKKRNHYTPESHIKILKKLGHIKNRSEEKSVGNKYKKLLKELNNYLFPESIEIISLLKKKGHDLILITLGVPSSQRKKVESSGIKKYFDKIIYETKNKSKNKTIIRLSKSKQEILIINDNAEEAFAMKNILGNKAKIFLINGPRSKNIPHKEKIYDNIKELKTLNL